jgi:hypothetical protein
MTTIIEKIEIARPPHDVYHRLIEEGIAQNRPGRLFENVLGLVSFEVEPPGRLEVGSRVTETIRTLIGYEEVLVLRIVELKPGAKYRARLISARRLNRFDKTFLFEPSEVGTSLTMIIDYGLSGIFGRSLQWLIANRTVHRVWSTALARLKADLEAPHREGGGPGSPSVPQ